MPVLNPIVLIYRVFPITSPIVYPEPLLYQYFVGVPRSWRPPGRILIFLIVLVVLTGPWQAPDRILIVLIVLTGSCQDL